MHDLAAPRPPALPSCSCSLGAIPIVNENDTVAVQELRIGDNDTLSAQVGGWAWGCVPAHGRGGGHSVGLLPQGGCG